MSITQQITALKATLPSKVKLVAVSKYNPTESILEALSAGQIIFGESQAQELCNKVSELGKIDITQSPEFHFIGHLQTNKVKYIAPFISVIESVDSERLIAEINKQAIKNNRVIDCFLELHIAQEESKSGLSLDECRALLASGVKERYPNVRICGLMTIASNTEDESQIHNEFALAYEFFKEVKQEYFPQDDYFCERSWGMSDDYPIAIQHGATLVRIGSLIFGERQY